MFVHEISFDWNIFAIITVISIQVLCFVIIIDYVTNIFIALKFVFAIFSYF